jgi:hypothetical protein
MFTKLRNGVLAASVFVTGSAMAQTDPTAIESAASTFSTDFGAAATAIGGALLAAGAGALVFKWAKGMMFS